MSPSPRAIEQYLACESIRTESRVMPSSCAIRAFVPWSEWPASTDSQNEASESAESEFIEMRDNSGEANERCGTAGTRVSHEQTRLQSTTAPHLEGAGAADGDKEGALLAFGLFRVDGQVRAPHDADDDLTVLDQSEADGVLPPAEEPLRAVDRVEGPVPAVLAAVRVAAVDQVEPLALAACSALHLGPLGLFRRERERLGHGLGGEADDLVLDGGLLGLLQLGRVFFADDLVLREVVEQEGRDESLRSVVADWRGIRSVQGAGLPVPRRPPDDGGAKPPLENPEIATGSLRPLKDAERVAKKKKKESRLTGDRTLVLLLHATTADKLLLHLLREQRSLQDGRDGDLLFAGVCRRRRHDDGGGLQSPAVELRGRRARSKRAEEQRETSKRTRKRSRGG